MFLVSEARIGGLFVCLLACLLGSVDCRKPALDICRPLIVITVVSIVLNPIFGPLGKALQALASLPLKRYQDLQQKLEEFALESGV